MSLTTFGPYSRIFSAADSNSAKVFKVRPVMNSVSFWLVQMMSVRGKRRLSRSVRPGAGFRNVLTGKVNVTWLIIKRLLPLCLRAISNARRFVSCGISDCSKMMWALAMTSSISSTREGWSSKLAPRVTTMRFSPKYDNYSSTSHSNYLTVVRNGDTRCSGTWLIRFCYQVRIYTVISERFYVDLPKNVLANLYLKRLGGK